MTTGIRGARPQPLPQTRDAEIDPATLNPWIQKYAAQYGVNPQIMGGVVMQESSFVNHGVHRDGTGHGLVGLDDNGLLPDFEKWSGVKVGRGRRANTIAPEKQIEFLAKTLASFSDRLNGDEWGAVRAWHAGMKGRNRSHAREYEGLIRGHVRALAAVIPPFTAGGALASNYTPASPERVKLRVEEGTTPVRGGIDYEHVG